MGGERCVGGVVLLKDGKGEGEAWAFSVWTGFCGRGCVRGLTPDQYIDDETAGEEQPCLVSSIHRGQGRCCRSLFVVSLMASSSVLSLAASARRCSRKTSTLSAPRAPAGSSAMPRASTRDIGRQVMAIRHGCSRVPIGCFVPTG